MTDSARARAFAAIGLKLADFAVLGGYGWIRTTDSHIMSVVL